MKGGWVDLFALFCSKHVIYSLAFISLDLGGNGFFEMQPFHLEGQLKQVGGQIK